MESDLPITDGPQLALEQRRRRAVLQRRPVGIEDGDARAGPHAARPRCGAEEGGFLDDDRITRDQAALLMCRR